MVRDVKISGTPLPIRPPYQRATELMAKVIQRLREKKESCSHVNLNNIIDNNWYHRMRVVVFKPRFEESEETFLRFGFWSRNSDRTKTQPNRDQIVFLRIYWNSWKKTNSSVLVLGIGSDSELGFFRFGFWSQTSDRTETELRPNPRLNRDQISRVFRVKNLVWAICRPLIQNKGLYTG